MKFNKIVAVDYTGIDEFVHDELVSLCDELIMYDDFPTNENEIIKRCKDAECILVSWNTKITKNIIKNLPELKYIGMCCSLYDEQSANVDIKQARKQNIIVKGVINYGDNGVVEFIYSELIRLFKGLGEHQYKPEQIELEDINLGIIGLGTVGKMVADTGNFFNMNISYHSRNIKNVDYKYFSMEKLLKNSDVISTHLPRNIVCLGKNEFELFGDGKVLINTGLCPSFEIEAFEKWIENKHNFAILDIVSLTDDLIEKYGQYNNIIISSKCTGFTKNARRRLAKKVINNIEDMNFI
ncbi:dihydrofolate reductase [Sedimentibacter sp. zth1]|uniref:NAD(P)-dependent oxidoreductase n=1 Tax=Sedimentibacter sp. zth1 TaxID=2816908 RepID=UPI001A92BB06|nr:NAD(P)-dependent oxidoreductase [Sedimentibacter sp. zth1]QSX06526.1 dihydrofolate reductase [Sedimentibacter sp. zth1]